MATATITSKGQATIPKEIRDRLGLQPGDKVDFVVGADGQVVVKPRTIRVRDLYGLLHRKGRRPVSVEEMNAAIAEGAMKGER